MKKSFLKNFTIFTGETSTQVVSCEYCITLRTPVLEKFYYRHVLKASPFFSAGFIIGIRFLDYRLFC